MKQRILYIDRIKGLAIILVVVGHLYTFSEATDGNLVNKFIGSFHMALFMFVSGFVAYILPPPLDYRSLLTKLLNRCVRYIVPMYVVGWLLYLFALNTVSPDNNMLLAMRDGVLFGNWYWYLKALAIFSLLSVPIMHGNRIWIDVICVFIYYALFRVLWKYGGEIGANLCMEHATCYFPFFSLGLLTRKYSRLQKLMKSEALLAISIVGYVSLFFFTCDIHIVNTLSNRFMLPVCAIVVAFNTLSKMDHKQSKILQGLEYFGNNSLQVYLFHYFFVLFVNIHVMWKWGMDCNNNLFMHLCVLMMSIIIAALSVSVGELLKYSKYIGKLIYGK